MSAASGIGRFGLFGRPLAHSLSPRIHAAFADQLGLRIDYRLLEAGPGDFAPRLDAFARHDGKGANITLPLKQDAVSSCAELGDAARQCGSVNTLTRVAAGWRGDSTDGAGLIRDLQQNLHHTLAGRAVLLLGAGGAAAAAAFALLDAGVDRLVVANRTLQRAQALANACGSRAQAVAWTALSNQPPADLVIHATSAGHARADLQLPGRLVAAHGVCYDLSYGRAATPFLEWAQHHGARHVHDGLGMLVEQAAESCAIWHGRRPDTTAVHRQLRRMLDAP